MKNKNYTSQVFIIAAFVVLFLVAPIVFRVYEFEILPSQFFGALIGVFITAIVTAFLLRGQTEGDEKREKSVKIFEKKQEVYHLFLEKLQKIIQKIGKGDDGAVDSEIDELKDLIFQLAFVQMHTETKNTDKILDYLAEIIETLNEFNNNTDLESFYIKLSERLFEIVAVLKSDLYGKKDESKISMKRMENVLKLKIKAATKYEMLEYFLSELYRQIREKGYLIDGENDFKHQARQFYDGNGYCHLGIELEEGTWLSLDITRKEGFFYGVGKGDCVWSAEEKLRIEKVFLIVNANKEWFFRC